MEYRILQDKPHNKEALVAALTLWLRNVAPVKAKPSSLNTFARSLATPRATRPVLKPFGGTGQHYRILAPGHDIFSNHQLQALGRLTLQPGLHLELLGGLGNRNAHFFLLDRHEVLIVRDPSMHVSWRQLPFRWDRPLPTTMGGLVPPMAAPRISSPLSGINVAASSLPIVLPVGDIGGMGLTEKLLMAAALGLEHLPGHIGDELWAVWDKLNTPLGWSTMIAIVVALALFGEIIAVLLAATGAALALYDLMTQVLDLFRQYYEAASNARSRADIEAAGALFGKAVAKGLLDIIDLFFATRQTLKSVGRLAEMFAHRSYTPGFVLVWIEEVLTAWRRRRMSGQGQLIPLMGELPPPTPPHPGMGKPGDALPGPKPRNVPSEGTGSGGSGPSRTSPSGSPNPDAKPTGERAKLEPKDKVPENRRATEAENRTAEILAKNGYKVKQKRPVRKEGKEVTTADYEVEGKDIDCYAPERETSARSVWSNVRLKVEKGQTKRVVLNLEDWSGDVETLKKQFNDWPIDDLEEIMMIDKNGKVQHIFP